jgi:ubiquinone/menaquinone biosynthesis C-methylase UbiE
VCGALGTGRDYVEKQYADDRNLAARQSIYSYQRPQLDLHHRSLDLAALQGDEAVLDIGCGNGRYLEALRTRGHRGVVAGADLSAGMLRTARPAIGDGLLLVSDAQALPFSDASFDVVLAMHMLYHVPDRAKAIAELRRVVRDDGPALVLTNSKTHFQELDEVLIECATATVGASQVRSRPSLTLFTAETAGAELEATFADVTEHRFVSELVVDAVEPVIAYARSMGAFVVDDDYDAERATVIAELERRLAEIIATEGTFRITTACATFVCR